MSNYFFNERQGFIKRAIYIYGYINRAHLVRRFDISSQQASNDLKAFNQGHPDALTYCPYRKTYLARDYPKNLTRLLDDPES